jgi:fructose-1,6-bisphosphatase/inositol monophosphatase family enzyme
VSDPERLLALLLGLQRRIRDAVVAACERDAEAALAEGEATLPEGEATLPKGAASSLATVADDGPGDTIYAVDKVSEELLVHELEASAEALGGIRLVAEGIPGGALTLPRGRQATPAWRVIVDPIDGTRGIMYQKRSAWVLSAVAPERGDDTSLKDVIVAAQTEIPTLKQHLSDELWAIRGRGATLERFDRVSGRRRRLPLRPTGASSIEHGYAMISRFFPGCRDELAAIDEEIMLAVLGKSPPGKALCFEDQYASTGGQLYELTVGHDRFNADLRPLMQRRLEERGQGMGLCCHPYDLCTALIAQESGVILTNPAGGTLDVPLDVHADVAWVGYANAAIRAQVEPALRAALERRGLIGRARGS